MTRSGPYTQGLQFIRSSLLGWTSGKCSTGENIVLRPAGNRSTVTVMPEDAPKFTIREDYDPDGDLTDDADPMAAYLTYREDVRIGFVVDMGFTLTDFREHIESLHRPPG